MTKAEADRTDHRGGPKKTSPVFRASKKNPYICDHCGYRVACHNAMRVHLRKVHDDRTTDPRAKWIAIEMGKVG
jgi:hypothetical protein